MGILISEPQSQHCPILSISILVAKRLEKLLRSVKTFNACAWVTASYYNIAPIVSQAEQNLYAAHVPQEAITCVSTDLCQVHSRLVEDGAKRYSSMSNNSFAC